MEEKQLRYLGTIRKYFLSYKYYYYSYLQCFEFHKLFLFLFVDKLALRIYSREKWLFAEHWYKDISVSIDWCDSEEYYWRSQITQKFLISN